MYLFTQIVIIAATLCLGLITHFYLQVHMCGFFLALVDARGIIGRAGCSHVACFGGG